MVYPFIFIIKFRFYDNTLLVFTQENKKRLPFFGKMVYSSNRFLVVNSFVSSQTRVPKIHQKQISQLIRICIIKNRAGKPRGSKRKSIYIERKGY